MLPAFNGIMNEQLSIELAFQPLFLCVALLLWLVTTVLAASYPALYMSGFPPLMAISQGKFTAGSSHATVRKVLTVGQFAIATVLIAWLLTIQTQISFMNSKDLGYNPHNLIYIWSNSEALENDYRAETSVEAVSRSSSFLFDGSMDMLSKSRDDQMGSTILAMAAKPNFIDFMQMKLLAGRTLPETQRGDTIIPLLLNRAAVDYLGMTPEEAIGKKIIVSIDFKNPEVCGVVENFHYESLHSPVRALLFYNTPDSRHSFIMLRVKEGNMAEQLKTYERIFKKHHPNDNFNPSFADLSLARAYEGERRTSHVAIVFSLLAIFVACMGVFGLTAFMAEQRTKEIGIRKVMGASVANIVTLFTNSYVKLLGISLVIAIPVAWWVCDKYLQNFAYRISLSWWVFVAAAVITIALALLTVCFQAIKAATANPVKSLKME
jgi:ABC-type antimicrobial peptide transport system permease subunit